MTGGGLRRRGALALGAAALLPRLARAQPAVVRIGVLNDMSGPYRDGSGPTSAACVRQAVEDLAPGLAAAGLKVDVLTGDHQNKPDLGLNLARQWFDRGGVDLIVDVPTTAIALAVNALARERNKSYINCGAGSIDLTGKECTPNTVHWAYDTTMLATTLGSAITRAGGGRWFFITADYAFGHQLQQEASAVVTKAGGSVVGAARYPFPSTTDFSSLLLQAQTSGADVIGLANAGDDTVNCVKQAREFGLTGRGIRLASLLGTVTVAHSIGLETAQGLLQTESFYWDLNDRTRAFAARVVPKTPRNWPNAVHAGCYAGTLHFLKTLMRIGVARKADGAAVIAAMKAEPADDDCFGRTVIRADGRAMVTPYLFQLKAPAESRSEWDLFNVLGSMPPEQTAPPVTDCKLVKA